MRGLNKQLQRVVLCGVFALTALRGADFFVATTGTAQGDGSLTSPWDIETAFRHPSAVQPGDTVYLRGGRYAVAGNLNLNCRLAGNDGSPITIRPYGRERVVIDGGIYVLGPWVVIRDLEIRNTTETRESRISGSSPTDITQPIGINSLAPHVRIINNVVRDASNGLASWSDAPDNEFYGNIVFNNGWRGPDRPHGHGVYMQNRAGAKTLSENIVFNNFEFGVQIYGSAETALNNFRLEGNVIFGNGSPAGEFTRNILLGGTTPVVNPALINNYTYFPLSGAHGGDNNIGYYPNGSGCTGLVMEGNYFASGGLALTMHNCQIKTMKGNTFVGNLREFAPGSWANENTFLTTRPTANRVFVRPNAYERGRSHIVVYNWERQNSIEVDLAGTGLESGDVFEIRDVQNLDGIPLLTTTYNGGPVRIPMTGTAVTRPHGNTKIIPAHTDREFGVFLVRRIQNRGAAPDSAHVDMTGILEAETLSRMPGITVEALPNDSGEAVRFPSDGSGILATFVEIPSAGFYTIWLRARKPFAGVALVAALAGEEPPDTHEIHPGSDHFEWTPLARRNFAEGAPLSTRYFYLEPGSRFIAFACSDPELLVDSILITNDESLTLPESDPANRPLAAKSAAASGTSLRQRRN